MAPAPPQYTLSERTCCVPRRARTAQLRDYLMLCRRGVSQTESCLASGVSSAGCAMAQGGAAQGAWQSDLLEHAAMSQACRRPEEGSSAAREDPGHTFCMFHTLCRAWLQKSIARTPQRDSLGERACGGASMPGFERRSAHLIVSRSREARSRHRPTLAAAPKWARTQLAPSRSSVRSSLPSRTTRGPLALPPRGKSM